MASSPPDLQPNAAVAPRDKGEQSDEAPPADRRARDGDKPPKKKHKKRKASNGRFKKLWRRATGPPPGIVSRSEWIEFADLHERNRSRLAEKVVAPSASEGTGEGQKAFGGDDSATMMGPLPGPSLVLSQQRNMRNPDEWQNTECSDHRDILLNLIFGEEPVNDIPRVAKKRKTGTSSHNNDATPGSNASQGDVETTSVQHVKKGNVPPLPPWTKVCNLAGLEGIAVIEFCIDDTSEKGTCLLPSRRIRDTNDGGDTNIWSSLLADGNSSQKRDESSGRVTRKIRAACNMKLFQGNNPRSISDVLMLVPPHKSTSNTANEVSKVTGTANIQSSKESTYCMVHALILKPRQLRTEGYPIAIIKFNENGVISTSEEARARKSAGERILEISDGATSTSTQTDASSSESMQLVEALSVEVEVEEDESSDNGNGDNGDMKRREFFVKPFLSRDWKGNDNGSKQPRVFALDCEMVKTSSGPELARVTVIAHVDGGESKEETEVLLDELVKPRRPVLDYLTEYSGISAKMLRGIETRIEEIQVRLLAMIHENDILVGHSAENDLKALRIVHDKVVDTSMLFRGDNGRKFALRHLSATLLKKQIQTGCGSSGHCSKEDAHAALILALRRARLGKSFQLKENSGNHKQNMVSLLLKATKRGQQNGHNVDSPSDTTSCFAGRDLGPSVCIGPCDWISRFARSSTGAHALSCESVMDSAALAAPSWLSSNTRRAAFLWAKFDCSGGDRESQRIDEVVEDIVRRVPMHTSILFVFQIGLKRALSLGQQRKAMQNPKSTLGWSWTLDQESKWNEAVDTCRTCEALWLGSH